MNNNKILELSSAYRPPALFDIYPFIIGYSLRRLNKSVGICMQIKRASDLALTEVFFGPSGTKITKFSLTTSGETIQSWANGSICYVHKWYNQGSGGSIYDLKQDTANLPLIYNGSDIVGLVDLFRTGVHFEFAYLLSDYAPNIAESSLYFQSMNYGANSDYRRAFSVIDSIMSGTKPIWQVNTYAAMNIILGAPAVEKIDGTGNHYFRVKANGNSAIWNWMTINRTIATKTKIAINFIDQQETIAEGTDDNYWYNDISNSKIMVGLDAGLIITEIILYDTPLSGQIKIDVEDNLNTQ